MLFHKKISFRSLTGYILAPLSFLYIIFFVELEPGRPEVTYTLAVALLMAVWWITEIIPLAVTSLAPVVLFPLLGIMDGKDVASTYFNHVIFLFIGGFLVALAMQKWDLHKRIALRILMVTGSRPGSILLGFMLATAFLSMWISNTATAMMMIPILIAVLGKLEEHTSGNGLSRFSIGLLLGVAYSASIGGVATLVGTPPNLSFARIFQIMFPEAPDISFTQWFLFALPFSVTFFIIVWVYLYFRFRPDPDDWKVSERHLFHNQYQELGTIKYEEKVVLSVFLLLAFLWLSRADLQFGNFIIPGWSGLFKVPEFINDGTVAIAVSSILFFIPSKNNETSRILTWQTAAKVPWHIVLLFGGGFALATGFKESGLSLWFGEHLSWMKGLHPVLIILLVSLMMTFLTELTSNTATTEMLLPILAGLSVAININPLVLMIPATISASMAFMLPVATPPNAIIFGTDRIRIADMARTGLLLNFIGAILVMLFSVLFMRIVFGFTDLALPAWAITP
jgi:sodium-dependent dicarboxylate transporter 2/3/5